MEFVENCNRLSLVAVNRVISLNYIAFYGKY